MITNHITNHIPNIQKLSVQDLGKLQMQLAQFIEIKKQRDKRIRATQYKARNDVHPVTTYDF